MGMDSGKVVTLPNIRKMFIPDLGYILCDCDLSGADAQVVAWEANATELKDAFKAGLDVHNFNGQRLWGDSYQPKLRRRKLTWRDECKRSVHGTNYLSGVRGMAKILGWSLAEVGQFQETWFHLNPGILDWHERIEREIQLSRQIRNKLGYRITYFDRPDNLLPKAVAWIPQSTVAGVCSKGAVRLSKEVPWANILLQVHDSLVFQIPRHRYNAEGLRTIRRTLSIEVPYDDPLVIPWGLAFSDRSWGEVQKIDWKDAA